MQRTRWISFLGAEEISTTPVLYQHLTDLMFRAMLRPKHSIQHINECEAPAVTDDEANGYVCRHLKQKLECSSHPLKEDMIHCLQQLVRGGAESDEKCGVAEKWMELVDRGGLWKIWNSTFQVFYALEVQSSLQILVINPLRATGICWYPDWPPVKILLVYCCCINQHSIYRMP